MLERLRRTLVETYIGAVALGYLLAQVVVRFTDIFVSPLVPWAMHEQLKSVVPGTSAATSFLQLSLAELAGFLALLLVWYLLFRWLYFHPFQKDEEQPAANPGQAV